MSHSTYRDHTGRVSAVAPQGGVLALEELQAQVVLVLAAALRSDMVGNFSSLLVQSNIISSPVTSTHPLIDARNLTVPRDGGAGVGATCVRGSSRVTLRACRSVRRGNSHQHRHGRLQLRLSVQKRGQVITIIIQNRKEMLARKCIIWERRHGKGSL